MNGIGGCANITPSIDDAFYNYFRSPGTSVLFFFALISTAITLVIFLFATKKIREHNPVGSNRRRSLFLIFGLFPVFATTSLCGIIIPRAANTLHWISSIYLGVTIYSFFHLLTDYFGGLEGMITFYQKNEVSYAQAPFLCCCRCLPKVHMSRRQFMTVRHLVLQVAIVRPVLVLISAVLWADAILPDSVIENFFTVNTVFGTLSGVSTGLAIYGIQVFSRSGAEYLDQYYARTKFVAIQLVLIFSSGLDLTLSLLQQFDVLTCRVPFTSPEIALTLYNHILIHLMAVTCGGLLFYWVWLSRFSDRRESVDKAPSIPDIEELTAQHEDMDAVV